MENEELFKIIADLDRDTFHDQDIDSDDLSLQKKDIKTRGIRVILKTEVN